MHSHIVQLFLEKRSPKNAHIQLLADSKKAGYMDLVGMSNEKLKQTNQEIDILEHLLLYCKDVDVHEEPTNE